MKHDDIKLDQTIKLIAKRTGVHITDVELVFDELRNLVLSEAATKRIDIGVGHLKVRLYGWKNYQPGLQFVPSKSVIQTIRERIPTEE